MRDAAKMKAEKTSQREIRLLQLMIDEPQITKEQLNNIKAKVLVCWR